MGSTRRYTLIACLALCTSSYGQDIINEVDEQRLIATATADDGGQLSSTPGKQVALYYALGAGSGQNAAKRTWNWGSDGGFEGHFARLKKHYDNDGVRIFVTWMPWASNTGQYVLDFDSAVEIVAEKRAGLISDEQYQKIRWQSYARLLRQFLVHCPEAEHHSYLGSLPRDPDMTKLRDLNPSAYIRRVERSIVGVLDASKGKYSHLRPRNGIMLDHTGGGRHRGGAKIQANYDPHTAIGSPELAVVHLIESFGHPVTLEPHPFSDDRWAHLRPYPQFVLYRHWKNAGFGMATKPDLGRVFVLGIGDPTTRRQKIDASFADPHIDVVTVFVYDLDYAMKKLKDSTGNGEESRP